MDKPNQPNGRAKGNGQDHGRAVEISNRPAQDAAQAGAAGAGKNGNPAGGREAKVAQAKGEAPSVHYTSDEEAPAQERDWSKTLFLPKTGFGMKAGLPQLEPKLLQRWEDMNLYKLLRNAGKARERFVLHDGPPYANGNIHIGTGLNKILKDAVVRSQQMMGKDANYVPGWDCHGLPIEWKVEEHSPPALARWARRFTPRPTRCCINRRCTTTPISSPTAWAWSATKRRG